MIRKLLLLCLFLFTAPAVRAVVYYVDAGKPNNTGNGRSWATAKKDIQDAINAAATGDEIWVKAGTYRPTLAMDGLWTATPAYRAFSLIYNDVKLYGGFAGTETLAAQRNASLYVTILSGDLDGNAGTNDAFHVLVTNQRTAACVIDGFTITGGRADSSGYFLFYPNGIAHHFASFENYNGAGVYNYKSSPTISNCIIRNNSADNHGAGMYNNECRSYIYNCSFMYNISAIGMGGGISNYNEPLSVTLSAVNCTFSNNVGNGIENLRGSMVVSNCTFNNNSSDERGAGIFHNGNGNNLTVTDCSFSNNFTNTSGGGAVNVNEFANGSMVMSGCTFNNNTAQYSGGALLIEKFPTVTISDCSFSSNTSRVGNGGAVFIDNLLSPYPDNTTINNCTFSSNTAGVSGGGIYNYVNSITLNGCVFNNNIAGLTGGGISGERAGVISVSNSIFTHNAASGGGGIYREGGSSMFSLNSCTFSANTATGNGGGIYNLGTASITNCILSGNTGGPANRQNLYDVSRQAALSYSLIADWIINNPPTFPGVIAGAPAFIDAANPAGPDGIFRTADDGLRIGCTSAARDAGTGSSTPATDILGNPRIGITDMGAYEHPGTGCTNSRLYVDRSMAANGNGYSWSSAKRDLQEAINEVVAGGEVWVKAGTYLPTRDLSGNDTPADARDKTFYLTTKDVKVYGGFAGTESLLSQRNPGTNRTILSGDLDGPGGTNDAYHVLITGARTAACVVDGFTITGGRANGSGTLLGTNYNRSRGGGIYNVDGTPEISNCVISNNSAGTLGGGMCNASAAPKINTCIFSANTAGSNGGALLNENSNPSISSCTFNGNTATQNGGGIYSGNNSGGSIINCILSGNTGGPVNRQNIYREAGPGTLTVSYTLIGDYSNTAANNYAASNILTGDPFVDAGNPAGPDGIFRTADDGLRIGCGSPARNAGTGSTPVTDILGNARVGAIDLGAYEYQGTACPAVMYVNSSRPDNTGNGTSWTTAKKDIQAAINEVAAGGEVWVRTGTYLPTRDPNGNAKPADARDKTFYLTIKDVKLYGGFAGTESLLSQRNARTNLTTLSGDLDGPGGTNDAYHVLITGARTTACLLDGFTITGGRATGSGTVSVSGIAYDRSDGGGMLHSSSSPTISNCIVSNNLTGNYGGGMYNISSSPVLSGCTFTNNTSSLNGGGLYNNSSNATISNCAFNTNTAIGNGGGIFNLNSPSPVISSCIFNANTAGNNGGGLLSDSSGSQLDNCVFSANTAGNNGGGISAINNSNLSIRSCTFGTNTATQKGGGMYTDNNSGGSIANCILSANTGNTANRQNIYKEAGTGVLTLSYTLIGDYSSAVANNYTASNILTGNPFVDVTRPAGADGIFRTADDGLRIGCASPARNAGTGSTPVTDILGNARVGVIDLGAYEYQGTACPTTMYVSSSRPDNSGDGTSWASAKKDIQEALNEVAAGGEVWVKAGTYLPTLDPDGNAAPADARDKTFYLTAKDVKLYGGFAGIEGYNFQRDPRTNLTILSGDLDGSAATNDAYHVLITSGRTTDCVVDGFTITAGRANSNSTVLFSGTMFDRSKAGGLYNLNGSPAITNCIFDTNTAISDGGAIYNKDGNSIITGCTFRNNSARAGGGMYNSFANPTINGCNFSNNTASQNGGGLLNDNSSLQISNCDFTANTATASGGGLYNLSSSTSLSSCSFSTNAASAYGGGIYTEGGSHTWSNCVFSSNTAVLNGGGMFTSATSPVISNCIFSANAAGNDGGGLLNESSNPSISNCIFSNNTAGNDGGGLLNENSNPSISSCTFSANTAAQNGGGICSGNNSGGSIINCILSGNTGGPANRQNIYKDAGTGTLTISYTLIGDYSAGAANNYTASNIRTGDPLFVNAGNPAGADGIFRTSDDGLRITNCASPARNAGTGSTPATDILGNVRLGTIDLGAYEHTGTGCSKVLYVNIGRPNNGGNGENWATAKKDLQAAINAAADGDEIWVKAGIYLPTLDPGGSATPADVRYKAFYLTSRDVKLYGGFSGTEEYISQRNASINTTTLSGDLDGANGTNDAYHVLLMSGRTNACVVDGFTISGGRANTSAINSFAGVSYLGSTGGGIYSRNSSPVISNCIISNNAASLTGGGISNETGSMEIRSCTFNLNTAGTRGGGFFNDRGSAVMSNCAFNSNSSAQNGGGLANLNNSNLSVSNCTFSANTASQNGGGLVNGTVSNLSISNCTFSANAASVSGGGLANVAMSIISMNNCTLSGNTANTSGGGIFSSFNGSGSIANCILSGNMGGPLNRQNIYKDTGASTITVSYTLIDDYSSTATNNYTSGAGIIVDDPLFVDAGNPAGADGKLGTVDDGLTLQSCSPAVNSGTMSGPALPQDMLNNNRMGVYDLGAYEYQLAATVPVLAGVTTTTTRMQYLGAITSFGDCNTTIAALRALGNQPVKGMVTAKVYVQGTTQMAGQFLYVRRHYDITPATGADTATAQITLYFTQADFDDYNTVRGTRPALPLDAADAAGNKNNVQITQEHGNSASGLPGSYSGRGGAGSAQTLITPQSVVWNALADRWEVTFPVTGFSGFFLNSGSAVPLPVKLLAFGAKRINTSLKRVEWVTAHEEAGTLFTIERSGDAKTFSSIGAVAGWGIFTGSEYFFEDRALLEGDHYYRLKIRESNGQESYSRTVLVKSGGMDGAVVTVFPNPASDQVTVRCTETGLLDSRAVLVDMKGRVIKEFVLEKEVLLDMHEWAAGVYVLSLADGSAIRIVRM